MVNSRSPRLLVIAILYTLTIGFSLGSSSSAYINFEQSLVFVDSLDPLIPTTRPTNKVFSLEANKGLNGQKRYHTPLKNECFQVLTKSLKIITNCCRVCKPQQVLFSKRLINIPNRDIFSMHDEEIREKSAFLRRIRNNLTTGMMLSLVNSKYTAKCFTNNRELIIGLLI